MASERSGTPTRIGRDPNRDRAARTSDAAVSRCEDEGLVGDVALTLVLPIGKSITVKLDAVSYKEPNGGFPPSSLTARCWPPPSTARTT